MLSAALESTAPGEARDRRIQSIRVDPKGTKDPQEISTSARRRTGDSIEDPCSKGRLVRPRGYAGARRPRMLLHDGDSGRKPRAFALQIAALSVELGETTIDEGELIPDRREDSLKILHDGTPGQDYKNGEPGQQHAAERARRLYIRTETQAEERCAAAGSAQGSSASHTANASAEGLEYCITRRRRGAGVHGWRLL